MDTQPRERIALYPGTFDPLTKGHESIVRRGVQVFDRIILAVAHENYKKPLFSLGERVEMASLVFSDDPRISVEPFQGLLVDFARHKKAAALLRGLRALSDFEYEFQLALMNRKMCPEIQTVFLMSDFNWLYVSSSLLKNVASLGGDVSTLLSRPIVDRMREKYGHPSSWPEIPLSCYGVGEEA